MLCCCFPLANYFTFSSVYMSMLLSLHLSFPPYSNACKMLLCNDLILCLFPNLVRLAGAIVLILILMRSPGAALWKSCPTVIECQGWESENLRLLTPNLSQSVQADKVQHPEGLSSADIYSSQFWRLDDPDQGAGMIRV